MPDFLLHLWAAPPAQVPVACPPPPPGAAAATTPGFLDPSIIRAAYSTLGMASAALVIAMVLICYLATRTTLGPRFVWRWYALGGASILVVFALSLALLRLWDTRVYPGSCSTTPVGFPSPLPWNYVIERAAAGAVWALLAYLVFSLLITRTAGWSPVSGGIFHNRGCPAPRWRP